MAEKTEKRLEVNVGCAGAHGVLTIKPYQEHPYSSDKSTQDIIDGADAIFDFLSSTLNLESFATIVYRYLKENEMAEGYKDREFFIRAAMSHPSKRER